MARQKKVFQGPGAAQIFSGTGHKLMREGRFEAALEQLLKYRAAYPGPQVDAIGVCLWCAGEYQAACEDWAFEIERHDRRETTYADFGAVTVPSLLWWASAHADLPDRDRYRAIAVKTLRKRAKTKRVQRSRRCIIVAYLLGEADDQAILGDVKEQVDHARQRALDQASRMMNEPVTNLHEYALEDLDQAQKSIIHEAHFYLGAKALTEGDIGRYRNELACCLEHIPPRVQPVEATLVPYELLRIDRTDI